MKDRPACHPTGRCSCRVEGAGFRPLFSLGARTHLGAWISPRLNAGVRHTTGIFTGMFVRPLLLAAFLCAAPGAPLRAQTAVDSLARGTRVQVHIAGDERQRAHPAWRAQPVRGTLMRVTPDTLFLRLAPATSELAVARPAIRLVERSRGVPSRWESGARGAVRGALLYLSMAVSTYTVARGLRKDDVPFTENRYVVSGAALGAASGLIIGALWPTERWRRVGERRSR